MTKASFRSLIDELLQAKPRDDDTLRATYSAAAESCPPTPRERALLFLARRTLEYLPRFTLTEAEEQAGETEVSSVATQWVNEGEWLLAGFAWAFLFRRAVRKKDLPAARHAASLTLGCHQVTLRTSPFSTLNELAALELELGSAEAALKYCATALWLLDLFDRGGPALSGRALHRLRALHTTGDAWTLLGNEERAHAAYREALTLARQHSPPEAQRLEQKLAL